MLWRVLGCNPGMGTGVLTTAIQLDGATLLDAGSGVGALDSAAQGRVRRILLTHSHLDHCGYLPFLAEAARARDDGPLTVYALPAVLETLSLHLFNNRLWPDLCSRPSREHPALRLVPVCPGEELVFEAWRAILLEVRHTVPAAGWWVEGGGRRLAFTGDTAYHPPFWEALKALPPLDDLIAEVTFPDQEAGLAERSGHLTPAALAAGLALSGPPAGLFLTHLAPGREDLILAQCRSALAPLKVARLFSGMALGDQPRGSKR